MFTKHKCTPQLYTNTRETLNKIYSAIFHFAVIRTPKVQKLNTCCYCNQTRSLSRVRHFYVCKKHLSAWGLLGAILAARATGKLKYRLNLPMGENESAAVIDVKSEDITTNPAPQKHAKVNPLARWGRGLVGLSFHLAGRGHNPAGQPNQTKEK